MGGGGGRGWAAVPALYSQRGASPPLYPPHGGEHSPVPPPTRRGSGLGCRLGRSWTVPTGHQDPPRTPQGPAYPWPTAKGFPQAIPTLAYPFRRPWRDGGSLPQNSAGRSPEKFSCQARLRFQNSGMKWRNFPCPHEPSLTTFKLTTSYPRSRSANSAKNPLGVFQAPKGFLRLIPIRPSKFRNALCGGIFLVPTSQVSLTLNLLGQKPLPGFLHAQIAPQEKSCYTRKSKALVGWEE